MKAFPIMFHRDYGKGEGDTRQQLIKAEMFFAVVAVPWDLIGAHEKQAQTNHSQSLKRLEERGGLSAQEALFIIEDRKWNWENLGEAESHRRLAEHVNRFVALLDHKPTSGSVASGRRSLDAVAPQQGGPLLGKVSQA